jgi:hypothetical protein
VILRLWHDFGCPYYGSMFAKSDHAEREPLRIASATDPQERDERSFWISGLAELVKSVKGRVSAQRQAAATLPIWSWSDAAARRHDRDLDSHPVP